MYFFRFSNLDFVVNFTSCLPPCRYTEFSLAKEIVSSTAEQSMLDLRFSQSSLVKRKEVLVYPLSSLVAEFGGTFGLFVGFSFLMFWDFIEMVIGFIAKIKK